MREYSIYSIFKSKRVNILFLSQTRNNIIIKQKYFFYLDNVTHILLYHSDIINSEYIQNIFGIGLNKLFNSYYLNIVKMTLNYICIRVLS
jgi:hypothetical protein